MIFHLYVMRRIATQFHHLNEAKYLRIIYWNDVESGMLFAIKGPFPFMVPTYSVEMWFSYFKWQLIGHKWTQRMIQMFNVREANIKKFTSAFIAVVLICFFFRCRCCGATHNELQKMIYHQKYGVLSDFRIFHSFFESGYLMDLVWVTRMRSSWAISLRVPSTV